MVPTPGCSLTIRYSISDRIWAAGSRSRGLLDDWEDNLARLQRVADTAGEQPGHRIDGLNFLAPIQPPGQIFRREPTIASTFSISWRVPKIEATRQTG